MSDSVKKFFEDEEDDKMWRGAIDRDSFNILFRTEVVPNQTMFYEILRSSIDFAKENPNSSREDILIMALRDWDL